MNYFVLKMPPFSFMPVINHKSFYILITQAVCLKIRVGGQGEKRRGKGDRAGREERGIKGGRERKEEKEVEEEERGETGRGGERAKLRRKKT